MEIQTEREERRRRRLNEVELYVARRLVRLRIDAGVRAPPSKIARTDLQTRVASPNPVRPRRRRRDDRRELPELPESTGNAVAHPRLEVRAIHRRAVVLGDVAS